MTSPTVTLNTIPNRKWWKEAVVYQIYPRSFKDSNGDGVGDIPGIIQKLDYIKSLGIDVVWLNPIYTSPNDDNGYDISDYRNIMQEMGTMEDFDALLKGLHDRGIKLVMDLVVNHCSDEHEWFQQSKSSRDNIYRDYFHWWPAENGVPPKRWSFFDEDENAWRYDETTDAWYLHYFSRKQPDLKWENEAVRKEVYELIKFWFDKGVDGFRMDVITFISKDTTFPELPPEFNGNFIDYYAQGPQLHAYLQEMNREVLSKYDVMTVGEGAGLHLEEALKLTDEDRHQLNMFFHFDHIDYGKRKTDFMYADNNNRSLVEMKRIFTKWNDIFSQKGWGTVYFGNHDQSRMVSRFGNDDPKYRDFSAKLLYTFLLSMRATTYVYYGDEIGMKNIRFTNIKDYRDIQTINYYHRLEKDGGNTEEFLQSHAEVCRDNGRTPMQWDTTLHAGFTEAEPWIKVNPDYFTVNAEAAEANGNSILHYFRKMVQLRKENLALVYGEYKLLDEENPHIYAFTRHQVFENGAEEKWLILLNFSKELLLFEAHNFVDYTTEELMISNYEVKDYNAKGSFELHPYEARIYKLL